MLSLFIIVEYNPHVISNLRNIYGRHCVMVGYEFLDVESIRQSNIGISVADATDSTKSESDLILTKHALLPISSAVQISREICSVMKWCMVSYVSPFTVPLSTYDLLVVHLYNPWFQSQVYVVSSTIHAVSTFCF